VGVHERARVCACVCLCTSMCVCLFTSMRVCACVLCMVAMMHAWLAL